MTQTLRPLTEAEHLDWLQLVRSDGIGPRTFAGLLARFGSAAAALEALPSLAKRRAGVARASRDLARREYDRVRRRGLCFVALVEPAYPPVLRSIDTAPPLLTVMGQLPALQKPMVAIVGSRNASGPGLIFTERLARGIGDVGWVVVSGLARGIDIKAHRASLAAGTVAVLAGGHDRVYPSEHADIAAQIAETGAVISEMPLAWEPRARDFPRRNRIVSGLSLGTVVVEAARRSGSLITARFANEQGREVFAVPGSPLDPRAEGTNDLIRQGATLCTSVDDVTDSLAALVERHDRRAPAQTILWETSPDAMMTAGDDDEDASFQPGEGDEVAQVGGLLGPSPIALDDLVRISGLSAARLRSILFDLELSGRATVDGGSVRGGEVHID